MAKTVVVHEQEGKDSDMPVRDPERRKKVVRRRQERKQTVFKCLPSFAERDRSFGLCDFGNLSDAR